MNIDMDRIIKQAKEQNFRYQRTQSGHHQFYAPNGKDIIVHSGTGSDSRGNENFMADMKRAGYSHGMGTLGEALGDALARPANGGAKLSVTQYVIDALARHPEGLVSADIKAIIKTQRPELADNAAYSSLNVLTVKGMVKKSASGRYSLTDVDRSVLKVHSPRSDKLKASTNGAAPPKPNGATHPKSVEIGERTGDSSIDLDLQALDNALAALAAIEGVVRKNREVLAQLAMLKKLLGAS